MKKILAIVLVMVTVLSLCACAPGGESASAGEGFRVGYSRVNIMPDDSVPLAGYGNSDKRMSKGFLDYIYATCLAITDENDNTVILFTTDLPRAEVKLSTDIREQVEAELGVPVGNIMVTASHTHSSVDINYTNVPSVSKYLMKLKKLMVESAKEALEDRKPVTELSIGNVEVEGLNFVRHYFIEDGTAMGDNFGDQSAPIKGHTTEVDPTMHIVKFVRQEGKDVILTNWRAHPTITGGRDKYDISADYIHPLREKLEKDLDCNFIFFQGDAGNVNPRSRIAEEDCTRDYKLYGQQLAGFVEKGLEENMKKIDVGGKIQTKTVTFTDNVNHTTDHLVPKAQEIQQMWTNGATFAECKEYGLPYGIRSPYMANGIIKRAKASETISEDLHILTIGDSIGICTAPNELFDTYISAMKEKSPYEMTLHFGYCNGAYGYIPSEFAFEYTCYESDTTRFSKGAGEKIAQIYLDTFNALKGAE